MSLEDVNTSMALIDSSVPRDRRGLYERTQPAHGATKGTPRAKDVDA